MSVCKTCSKGLLFALQSKSIPIGIVYSHSYNCYFLLFLKFVTNINNLLYRCITVSGTGSGLSLGGPQKVKAGKFFYFTEGSFKVENKEHLISFVAAL